MQGFWKNHPAAWPVSSLTIGGITYTESQLITVLKTPPKGDAVLILAHQLIAAELNLVNGAAHSSTTDGVIANADSLLSGIDLQNHTKVSASSALGGEMIADASYLDSYNNGHVV